MRHSLYCYAWDALDSAADGFVRDLRASGIDSLTMALSYHAGKFISPWHSRRRVVFPEDGTVYFPPAIGSYGDIEPVQAEGSVGIDVVRALRERHALPVFGWLVLLHNTRLGMRHPECTVRNAYGDPYPYSLCPANPAVATYAIALSRDAARRGVAGLKLETPGYLPYAHGYHHEFAQVTGNLWLENQLALCFCGHCMARAHGAGVDAEHLRRSVVERLDRYFAADAELDPARAVEEWFELVAADADFERFLGMRCAVVNELLEAICRGVAEVAPGIEMRVIPTVQNPHRHAPIEGSDLAAQSRIVDRLELPIYQKEYAACLADAEAVIDAVGGAGSLSAILRPGPPDMRGPEQLRDLLHGLAERGILDVSFYNLGLLRRANLCWIRDALNTMR